MHLKTWILGATVMLGFVCAGRGADDLVFSGTFQDKNGRTGPIQCDLTLKEPGKWTASFKAKNIGKGPNGPLNTTVDFTGKEEGNTLTLSGEKQLRPGLYVVSMTLVDKKTLTATFTMKNGGGDGTFEMTAGKAEAAPAEKPAVPQAATDKPAQPAVEKPVPVVTPAPAAEPAK